MKHSRRTFIGGTVAAAAIAATRSAPALARVAAKRRESLFDDQFKRGDRAGWGEPWFNQRYGRYWAIESDRAIFRLPATENYFQYRPNPVLVLDHDVTDVDLRTTLSMSNPQGRAGLTARAVGYGSYYVAYLSRYNQLHISRCTHQREVLLASGKAPHGADRRYHIRMQVRGTGPVMIRAKVWKVGSREPLRWSLETADVDPGAITTAGAFGMFFAHPIDRRSCAYRVGWFAARSANEPLTSSPVIDYAFAGPPEDGIVKLVAKSAVSAAVSFEVSPDPEFVEAVQVLGPFPTGRAQTAKVSLDVSGFEAGTLVHWRPVAERGSQRVVGEVHSFRAAPAAGVAVRLAFGSCTKWQVTPRQSFDHARLRFPDLYLHQGDFGYPPTKVVDHAADTYQDHWIRMLMDPSFSSMTRHVPLALIRDDSDYGYDRADRHTYRRFTVAAHNDLNANPGPYFETRYGDVSIFSIDCRRFSTGPGVDRPLRSKLGSEQKQWLKKSMLAAAGDGISLLVVSSPQAFGSDSNPAAWRKGYQEEWRELLDFFRSLKAAVLIISGDAHGHRLHEYPEKDVPTDVPRIVELVSSGTEQNKFDEEVDPEFILQHAKGSGFGLVELGPEQITGNRRTRTLTLAPIRTRDGTPFWTANYLLVHGTGLLPVVD